MLCSYWCPSGSTSSTQQPCQRVFLVVVFTLICSEGYYGSSLGLTAATCTAKCPAGSFCVAGSSVPQPCPGVSFVFVCSFCFVDCRVLIGCMFSSFLSVLARVSFRLFLLLVLLSHCKPVFFTRCLSAVIVSPSLAFLFLALYLTCVLRGF